MECKSKSSALCILLKIRALEMIYTSVVRTKYRREYDVKPKKYSFMLLKSIGEAVLTTNEAVKNTTRTRSSS